MTREDPRGLREQAARALFSVMRSNDVRALSNELRAIFAANMAGYPPVTLEAVSRDSGVSLLTIQALAQGKRKNHLPEASSMRLWATIDKVHPFLGGYGNDDVRGQAGN